MLDEETRRFVSHGALMLVGVEDDVATQLVHALKIPVLRVRYPRAACERMVATQPLVVAVGGDPSEEELAQINDVALAISAQVVILADVPAGRLELTVRAARQAAERLREGLGDP